jgi:toxin HigB-1
MIESFACNETERIFRGEVSTRFPIQIQSTARRKLRMLDGAVSLNDLRSPPGNRLEKLARDRVGQHSIRINDQFRVCFRFMGNNAVDVEIVDYH